MKEYLSGNKEVKKKNDVEQHNTHLMHFMRDLLLGSERSGGGGCFFQTAAAQALSATQPPNHSSYEGKLCGFEL